MELQTLFRVLWKKRWILIIVPFFSVCCAFLIRMLGEWKYKSTAQLATGLTITDDLIDNGKYFNPYEIQITFTNLIETIKSRAVMGLVSYKLLEHDFSSPGAAAFRHVEDNKIRNKLGIDMAAHRPEFEKILKEKLQTLTLLDPSIPEQKMLQKVIDEYQYNFESMLEELAIARVNNSDYIEITFISENPRLSAFVVNNICSEFIEYYSSVRASRSNVSLESLTSIVEQRKKYLDDKLAELQQFRSSNEMLNSNLESETKIRQIEEYEDQVASEAQRIRGLELTLASQKVRIQEAEEGMGTRPNEMIINLRRQINEMNERYIVSGQKDKNLLDSITALRSKYDQAVKASNERPRMSSSEISELKEKQEQTRVELEIARENLNSMNKILNSIRYSIVDFANKESVSKALEKEVEVAREEYLSSQAKFNEAKAKLVTNKMSIAQVLFGEPAEKPESRRTIMFMVFGGVLSFAVCAFVIVVLEMTDTSIRTPKRLKKMTKFNLAGVLPRLPKAVGEPTWNFFLQEGKSTRELNKLNQDLRKVRYEIENQKVQVMLVTSTKNGQGKSFFVMALAYSMSLIRKRTLIIDTNLRNNSLTKMLVARASLKQLMEHYNKNTKMLTNGNLEGENGKTEDADGSLITHTGNDLVDIIGNKTSQLSPSEIIPGGDFKVLLEWLRNQYDYIIMEGASLNEFSDTRELVSFVDMIIPVFSAESSITDKDRESLNFLRTLQYKLGPAVLNKVVQEE